MAKKLLAGLLIVVCVLILYPQLRKKPRKLNGPKSVTKGNTLESRQAGYQEAKRILSELEKVPSDFQWPFEHVFSTDDFEGYFRVNGTAENDLLTYHWMVLLEFRSQRFSPLLVALGDEVVWELPLPEEEAASRTLSPSAAVPNPRSSELPFLN
jgi:hypothetical protein